MTLPGSPPPVPGITFGFNPQAGRYVDLQTGRFLPRAAAFDIVDAAIEVFKLDGLDFIRGAIGQDLPLQVVERVLRNEVKSGYINTYVAGRGGIAQMTQRDWGIAGRIIRDKYEFVRGFMQDIAAGESEAQLLNRWDMYYSNMTIGYWQGDQEAQKVAGMTHMLRFLHSREPCRDCPYYAGYIDLIGSIPLPTEACECKGNCLCTVEYMTTEQAIARGWAE